MDRSVLLTGCSSGIGRETARAFLAEDWEVMATARDESDLAGLADAGCLTAALDVTDEEQIRAVVEGTLEAFGGVDCLVNNAGFSQVGPLEDVSPADLHRQFEVNVYGPHRLVRAVLPQMRAQGDGTIVNVSSVLGRLSVPGAGAYCASKFALEAMSDALRAEVSTAGIDVVVIEPGSVETRFQDRVSDELAALQRTDAYASLYRVLEDWTTLGGLHPATLEAETVADAIVNAASATQPQPRYAVGSLAKVGILGRLVPDRVRDAIYRLVLRATAVRRRE